MQNKFAFIPAVSLILLSAGAAMAQTPECPPMGLHGSTCQVTIDRSNPATPLPVTLPPNTKVVLRVINKSPFESIKKDVAVVAVQPPDSLSFLVQTLFPLLNSVPFTPAFAPHAAPIAAPTINDYIDQVFSAQEVLTAQLTAAQKAAAGEQDKINALLAQTWESTDDKTAHDNLTFVKTAASAEASSIDALLACGPSGTHGALCLPTLFLTDEWIKRIGKLAETMTSGTVDTAKLDAIIRNQDSLRQSLTSLQSAAAQFQGVQKLFTATAKAAATETDGFCTKSLADGDHVLCQVYVLTQANARQATINLSAVSAVDKTETKLVTGFVANWLNQPRFTLSAGVLFSTVVKHSYSAQPAAVTGNDQTGTTNALTYTITDAPSRQFIPFTFVNIRLFDGYAGNRYWSVNISPGVGVNASTTQTEFVIGPTFGIGSVYFTPAAHFAHPQALTGGFQVGNLVASGFAPPTTYVWRTGFAIGVSYKLVAK